MKKDMFPKMENYTSIIKITPEIYGFVDITALVGKNNDKTVHRIKRSMQYIMAFSALKDRMFAGLSATYSKIFELLKDKQQNNGNLKNYYMVAIESGNDIPRRIFSFDMYMLQADNYKHDLIKRPEYKNLPNIDDKKRVVGTFAFGYQYEQDMNSIDICNKVFHIKAYKEISSAIKAYNFDQESDLIYDIESEKCNQFIENCFNGVDRYIYDIGLEMEDYTHDYEDHTPKVNEEIVNDVEVVDDVKVETEEENS